MLVSVVIPVKNAETWIESVLKMILSQEVTVEKEIIILDSESTDGTLEILKKFPVSIVSIPKGQYNHGATRNYGISLAKGEIVVLTVQDAIPSNSSWLRELLDGFLDQNIVGVCGKQIVPVNIDMNPLEWFKPINELQLKRVFGMKCGKISSNECGWDNVTAAYRRSFILEKVPFRNVNFGEDAYWAKDVYEAGFDVIYNERALVYHYHHENKNFTYKRSIEEFYLRYNLFQIKPDIISFNWVEKIRLAIRLLILLKGFKKWLYWFSYNCKKNEAISLAAFDFLKHLRLGKPTLDKFYEETCSISVIANVN